MKLMNKAAPLLPFHTCIVPDGGDINHNSVALKLQAPIHDPLRPTLSKQGVNFVHTSIRIFCFQSCQWGGGVLLFLLVMQMKSVKQQTEGLRHIPACVAYVDPVDVVPNTPTTEAEGPKGPKIICCHDLLIHFF